MTTEPLVIERVYDAPPERIWQAITDRDKMKQWYFDISAFKPEVGFEFEFTGENEGRTFLHLCRITEVQENRKLAYTWKYKNFPGESIVTFELFPEGNKTRLRLTHEGLETFPADNPDFKRDNFIAGWDYIIGNSLRKFVEN